MLIRGLVQPNTYQDSVRLMRVCTAVRAIDGVEDVACVMGTERNKLTLEESGLWVPEAGAAGPDDLVLVVRGRDEAAIATALGRAAELLAARPPGGDGLGVTAPPHTLAAAAARLPGANLALISVPGPYAAAEARKALRLGLHVHLFSDNVDLTDEIQLKQLGAQRGLLVMGPDCGTALIHGVPLGFCNRVAPGPIGIVGAAGTGMQEVMVMIDRMGSGVSHALGTGGRDLSAAVGGITTLQALGLLEGDPDTRVVVLVAKAAGAWARETLSTRLTRYTKPVVAAMIGSTLPASRPGPVPAATLAEAAALAVALARGTPAATAHALLPGCDAGEQIALEVARKEPGRRYLRGLFAGGTLALEADSILVRRLGAVHSNTGLRPDHPLLDPWHSREHTVVDLGDDLFTRGRPHPIIDPTLRNERLLREAADPEVAVVLFDLILGVGAHSDPAGATAQAIRLAQEGAGQQLTFVASVCGTDRDPQGCAAQVGILRREGVLVLPSAACAADVAGQIAQQCVQGGQR